MNDERERAASDLAEASLLERIAALLPELRPSERKVGEVILADPSSAMKFTMAGLADAADISEPTVMRFCGSIGCSGFQDLKIQLAQTLAIGLPMTHSAILPGDNVADVGEKIFNHMISSLDRARRTLDHDAIARAIDTILASSEVLFVGFGASGIIAQDAQQKFPLFGVPCQAPTDFHQQFIAATMIQPGGVTFAISNTGSTAETIRVAKAAQGAGSTVIAMVGQRSALSEMADIAIEVKTFEDTDFFTPSVSRIAGLVVIDVIATGVALGKSPEYLARVAAMKGSLSTMRSPSRLVGDDDD